MSLEQETETLSKNQRYRRRHPERVRAQYTAKNAKRLEMSRRLFTSPFANNPVVSDALFERFREAGDVFTFQSAEHTIAWAEGLPEELRREIISVGVSRLIAQVRDIVRSARKSPEEMIRDRRARSIENASLRQAKVEAFDHIVEMLDHKQIGQKKLGDCTRGDLLREAVRLESEAGELTLDAALYRKLADVIGNQTVRAASGRDKIVALLTHRWADE